MIYEARLRLSAGKRKWMFTLSRNGRTIFVSDHSYHTRESAIRAARRRADDNRTGLSLSWCAERTTFKVLL